MTQQGRRPARFSRPRTPHPPKRRVGPGRPPVEDPARRAALDTLREVRARDAYANLLLPQLLRERRITGRDAALATELAYGACRARGLLDAVITEAAGRPPERINAVLLDLLRMGTYQLLRMRVDAHAAVSTTVEQAGIAVDDLQVSHSAVQPHTPDQRVDIAVRRDDRSSIGAVMAFHHADACQRGPGQVAVGARTFGSCYHIGHRRANVHFSA